MKSIYLAGSILLAGGLVAVTAGSSPADASGPGINMEIVASTTGPICPGDEVEFTLITRLLGGAPGIELRDVEVSNQLFPGETWTTLSPEFVAASDLSSDSIVAWFGTTPGDNSTEEFWWNFTYAFDSTTEVVVSDTAAAWFRDPNGIDPDVFVGTANAEDRVTIVVEDGPLCLSDAGASPELAATGSQGDSVIPLGVGLVVGLTALGAVALRLASLRAKRS